MNIWGIGKESFLVPLNMSINNISIMIYATIRFLTLVLYTAFQNGKSLDLSKV